MSALRREAEYFFGAIRFFTRLPVPAWVGHSPEALNHSVRYFPLVGIVVGLISALVFAAASFLLPKSLAVLFAMAVDHVHHPAGDADQNDADHQTLAGIGGDS